MFRPSTPVSADAFYDREQPLARLARVVETLRAGAPSWLAILGMRKIGKTSLLLEARRRARSEGVEFVLIDSLEFGPPSLELVRRLALRVVDAVLAPELGQIAEPLASSPQAYRDAINDAPSFPSLPAGLRRLMLSLPDVKLEATELPRLLALPEQLAEALDRRFLIAWDEFQALTTLARGSRGFDLYPLLRSAWQRQQRVTYVVSGSERSLLRALVSEHNAPFFQHFALMELGLFEQHDALALLRESSPRDRPIPAELATRAVDVLSGHPFYLQLFGEELTSEAPPYGDDELKAVMQRLLFSRTGRLALHFENEHARLVGSSSALANTLQRLATGPVTITELSRALGCASGSAVRYLERLGDAVARGDDGAYALVDRTFGLWLQWRRPGGTVLPMTLLGDEAEQIVAAELGRMGFDLVYQSRASRGAFDLLALRGARQLGVQVKRRALPLRFKKTEWNRMGADASRFGWAWLIASVDQGAVRFCDPQRARVGREARVDEGASINNLLRWVDEQP